MQRRFYFIILIGRFRSILLLLMLCAFSIDAQQPTFRITIVGDSLSFGAVATGTEPELSGLAYVNLMSLFLGPEYEIRNEAFGGARTDHFLQTIPPAASDLTVILLGGNDTGINTPAAEYKQNLETIIDLREGSNFSSQFLLVPFYLADEVNCTTSNSLVQEYHDALFELCSERSNVSCGTNLADIIVPDTDLGVHGSPAPAENCDIHPNRVGHAKIAPVVANDIVAVRDVILNMPNQAPNLLVRKNGGLSGDNTIRVRQGTKLYLGALAADPQGFGFPIFGNGVPISYIWDFGGADTEQNPLKAFLQYPVLYLPSLPVGVNEMTFNLFVAAIDAQGQVSTNTFPLRVTKFEQQGIGTPPIINFIRASYTNPSGVQINQEELLGVDLHVQAGSTLMLETSVQDVDGIGFDSGGFGFIDYEWNFGNLRSLGFLPDPKLPAGMLEGSQNVNVPIPLVPEVTSFELSFTVYDSLQTFNRAYVRVHIEPLANP